jgi:hypothetical protein
MDLDELIDWERIPPAPDKYDKLLHIAFRACDAQDPDLGVTTGEDDNGDRWIKMTVRAT